MTQGYVSDVPNDDTVMDRPTAVVDIRLRELPPQQALAVIQELEVENVSNKQLGGLVRGEDVTNKLPDATVHLSIGQALTALSAIGVVDIDDGDEVDQQG